MAGKAEQVTGAIVFAVVVGGALYFAGVLKIPDTGDDDPTAALPTTSTVVRTLDRLSYQTGDCVTWELDGPEPNTRVVDCTEPHRIQISERMTVESDGPEYPADEWWWDWYDTVCGPTVEGLLGHPLDPDGRFVNDAIIPTPEGWREADREAWCGVGANAEDGSGDELMTEDVRRADQAWHYAPGVCVAHPDGGWPHEVGCSEPHIKEIVGELDLSEFTEFPRDSQLLPFHEQCQEMARAYLGADPVPPWEAMLEVVTPEGWAAGTHTTHCHLGQDDANDPGSYAVVTTPAGG